MLVLLRHAEAEATRPGHRDRDRRLTSHGRDQAGAAGAAIRAHGWIIDHVLCSPAVRARETLDGLGLAAEVEVEIVESLYDGGSDGIIELIRTLPAQVRCGLVVGHAPSVPGVLHQLVDASRAAPSAWSAVESRFPPATLAAVVVDHWPDLNSARLDRAVLQP